MSTAFSRDDINKMDSSGKTVLFYAIERNNKLQVEQLLAQGANVNVINYRGHTPLHAAALSNVDESHFKITEVLLRRGVDVNAQDYEGRTPLYYLVENCNSNIIQLFFKFGCDANIVDRHRCKPLFRAVRYNSNVDVVQLLIDHDSNINYRDSNKETSLHWACDSNSIAKFKIIKCLLRSGANINVADRHGFTPLINAAYCQNCPSLDEEIIKKNLKFLIEHTDFEVICNINVNILTFRYYEGQPEFLWEVFLEHLAKLQSLDISVPETFFDVISKNEEYDEYYNQCVKELLRAKDTKFKNSWLTFYDFLVGSRKKLKNYAGNRDLIKDFQKSKCAKIFPIYGGSMIENVKKGLKRRELFDNSATLLSEVLPIFNPTHLIIRNVLDCVLSIKDLTKFCD